MGDPSLHTEMDLMRWLVLGMGSLLIGFSFATMAEARKFRMPPAHVWAIAISYVILVVAVMVEVSVRLGDGLTWRTWVALASFAFGLYSQWLMYRAYHYAARLRRHERKTVEAGNEIMRRVFERSSEPERENGEERRTE